MFNFLLRWVAKAFAWATGSLSLSVIKLLALKTFLISLSMTILPVALFKAYGFVLKYILSLASSKLETSGVEPATLQFIGFGAFLASHLMLPEAFAIILGAIFVSLVLRVLTLGIV